MDQAQTHTNTTSYSSASPSAQADESNEGADRAAAQHTSQSVARRYLTQFKASDTPEAAPAPDNSGGAPLAGPIQAKMEQSFGQSFSDVRVHYGSEQAADLGAEAYTQGSNIHVAGPAADQELMGHELTHVVQQRRGGAVPQARGADANAAGINADAGLEREADELGARAARSERVNVQGVASGVQRKETKGSKSASSSNKTKKTKPPPDRSQLNQARDQHTNRIATELVERVRTRLEAKAVLRLNAAEEGELRERIEQAAKSQSESDAGNGTNQRQAHDVKALAGTIAKASGSDAIATQAKKMANEIAPTTKAAFVNQAKESFNQTKVSKKGVNERLIKKAVNSARKSAAKIYEAQYQDSKAKLDKELADKAAQIETDLKKSAKTGATKGTKKTIKSRKAKGGDLRDIANKHANPEVKKIEKEINSYLVDKLGAQGAHWWRSDELKAFRKKMKDAGRKQASDDVDANMGLVTKGGAATKRYVNMDAKMRSYGAAKKSVNTKLTEVAGEGTTKVMGDAQVKMTVRDATRAAAFAELEGEGNEKSANKAAHNAAVSAAKEVLPTAKDQAKAWKDNIVKNADVGVRDTEQAKIADDVKQQVTDDEIGKKQIHKAIKANSAHEGMSKIGKMLDFLVPDRGDSVSLSVELRIPIPHSPAFVLISFNGEAARGTRATMGAGVDTSTDTRSLEVSAELQIGGGIDVWGLRADAAIGFFIRGGAKSTDKCMKALSYGAYRQCAQINDGLANFWSGNSTKGKAMTGMGDTQRAEIWAAMVEEQVFKKDDDAFVDLGMSARARGKVNAAKLQAEAEIRGERFRHFDKETIEQQATLGDASFDESGAKNRRKALKGVKKNALLIDAAVSYEIAKQAVAFGGSLSVEGKDDWSVDLSAGLSFDSGNDQATMVEKIVPGLVGGFLSVSKTLAGLFQQKGKKQATKNKGRVNNSIGIAEGMVRLGDGAFGNKIGTALASAYQVPAPKSDQVNETITNALGTKSSDMSNHAKNAGASAEYSLKLTVSFGKSGGSPTFQVVITEANARKLSFGGGPQQVGVDIEYATEKRIAGFGYSDGKWSAEGLGFRKSQK